MNTYLCLCMHARVRGVRELGGRESTALRWHRAGAWGHRWQERWMERFGGCRCWGGGAGFYGEEGTSRWTPAWGTCARRAGQGHPWVRQSLAQHILPARRGVIGSRFPALIYHLAFSFFLINGSFPIPIPQTIAEGPGTAPRAPFNFIASSSKARDAISPNSKCVRETGVLGNRRDSQVLN